MFFISFYLGKHTMKAGLNLFKKSNTIRMLNWKTNIQ